jgi:exosortase D (VPLPA-CTERM-specific)
MNSSTPTGAIKPLFFFTRTQLVAAAVVALALAVVFQKTLGFLYGTWQREEYSHGFLIPLISGFLLWQRRRRFEGLRFTGSWAGVAVVVLGLLLFYLGSIASITTVDAYALVIVIAGCLLAVMGWEAFKLALAPLALLLLMNPVPTFFYNNLSSQLQLISSQIGVAVIRLFGISVYLEGNVIDLGDYQLQVVEACSGLRYLFPLLTLGVIVACFFKGRAWMRWLIVLSTIPITVLMNSFRIGVIGVLVDRFGIAQAEGFLHDFEGWVIFMACFALLLLETWLLVRLGGERRPFRDIFALEFPPPRPKDSPVERRSLGKPALAALLVPLLAVYPARSIPERAELKPTRAEFVDFPMQIEDWRGQRDRLDGIYLDTLKLDDYVLANFIKSGVERRAGADQSRNDSGSGVGTNFVVNFYTAYYASQRTGQSAHSPRSCLPGGGWRMLALEERLVNNARQPGAPLRVNRAVIQQGSARQLVYYWFQQRGRDITNEYLVKWYLFQDALTRNRTDGALVRVITPLAEGEDAQAGDARLAEFTQDVAPLLAKYVPD